MDRKIDGWMDGVGGCRGENPKDLQFNTSTCSLILIISIDIRNNVLTMLYCLS